MLCKEAVYIYSVYSNTDDVTFVPVKQRIYVHRSFQNSNLKIFVLLLYDKRTRLQSHIRYKVE